MDATITTSKVSGCFLSNMSYYKITYPCHHLTRQMAYLHFKSRSINSFETSSCWARKPKWLSKLECCNSMLWSCESRLCPNSVRMLICSSSSDCFLSDERMIFTRVSKHLKLLESIASSTSFDLSLFCWRLSNIVTLEVSNSFLFDPRSFFDWSLYAH